MPDTGTPTPGTPDPDLEIDRRVGGIFPVRISQFLIIPAVACCPVWMGRPTYDIVTLDRR